MSSKANQRLKARQQGIITRILGRMTEDSRVNAAMVQVAMGPEGTVTLRGTVPDFQARRAAVEDAWKEPGVDQVKDFLIVPQPDPAAFVHPMVPGDEGIRAQVNQYLRGQDILDAKTIDVEVEDGKVTLRGSVNAYWKRRRAEELVLGVDGVKDLASYLTVVPTEGLGDDVTAETIVDSLSENYLIDPQSIDIRVNRGLVTLSGTVRTERAKREAFDIALNTAGVSDVRDELLIERA
jgi:osmotically-inducible protein OsmY